MCIVIYEVGNEHCQDLENGQLCYGSFFMFLTCINNCKIYSWFYCFVYIFRTDCIIFTCYALLTNSCRAVRVFVAAVYIRLQYAAVTRISES
jgi:hypothetical protein